MSDFRCSHCGKPRSLNLNEACPGCGSKKILGNYLFPGEIKQTITTIFVVAIILAVALLAALLFALSVYAK